MDLLEIIMLIIGVLAIIISCRLVARPEKQNETAQYSPGGLDTFKEEQSDILNSISEETIAKADDYLSKLSNEKIIAVSEYSDQILDKISRNHEEVIFLYNMLDHKEKEIKKMDFNTIDLDIASDSHKQLGNQAQEIKKVQSEKKANPNYHTDNEEDSTISINNAEIIKSHKEGKSVLDIAKQLGIGQGEVKLVIDLFKDRYK